MSAPWERATPSPPPPPCPLDELGVDVMSAARLSRALQRSPRLFERLCAPEERWEWTAPEGAGLAWACALWCAKEAAVKTLRTGFWREGIDWPMVVVGAEAAGLIAASVERASSNPRNPPDLRALTPEEVWARWAAWRRARLTDEAARRWGGRALWCCAVEREGLAWGWGGLSAPSASP